MVKLALIGAGNRGQGIFGQYALDYPHRARFIAVAEPDPEKRKAFASAHGISSENVFDDWRQMFAGGRKPAEGVVIATLEDERLGPALRSMEAGCHILIEKPLGCKPEDVVAIVEKAEMYSGVFIVCHVMRYTPCYSSIKRLVASGRFGKIVAIQHSENLAYSHIAHSFVRGFFNSSKLTPMILAKSCHDMDMLLYLVESSPRRIASFGSLSYFRPENAPEGAPKQCLDGCSAQDSCPYHVLKLYFDDDTDPAYLRQMGTDATDKRRRLALLQTNRFGRCVFHCDNDVVDHQTISILFENSVTGTFFMGGHNGIERRITKISMTNGEIYFDTSENMIKAYSFSPETFETVIPRKDDGTHMGGDIKIMDSFIDAMAQGCRRRCLLTSVKDALDGHLMAFAAEEARLTNRVVDLRLYEESLRRRKQVKSQL